MTEGHLLAKLLQNWMSIDTDMLVQNEPPQDKINKMPCAPSEDSDQHGHSPSLIIVFAVCRKKAWVLSYPLSAQRRLWSDWADAQADLSLRWAHTHFVGFVISWLILEKCHPFWREPSIYWQGPKRYIWRKPAVGWRPDPVKRREQYPVKVMVWRFKSCDKKYEDFPHNFIMVWNNWSKNSPNSIMT